jgi:hypothetical protein
MDSRLLLIQASQDLKRRVHSSLPWGLRLAKVLFYLRVGAVDSESFGRIAYGLFLLYGVTDMPPAPFQPRNTREVGDPRLRGYGREFGRKAVGYAQRFSRGRMDPVEEILAYVSLRLLSSSFREGVSGKPLGEAERYVMMMIKHQAMDQLRGEQRRRTEEEVAKALEDQVPQGGLEGLIPETEQEAIIRKLETQARGDPDLPEYFRLLLDGYSTNQILTQKMLPSLPNKKDVYRYHDIVRNVLRRHFQWAV